MRPAPAEGLVEYLAVLALLIALGFGAAALYGEPIRRAFGAPALAAGAPGRTAPSR